MSGNLSTYAGGGGRYIKDPRELPLFAFPETYLQVKLSNNSSTTCSDANASAFMGAVANRGAQASVAVAGTYVTCANLSGRGRLYSVIAPSYAAGAYTPTVRLTIDGVVYTITPGTTIGASHRMVLGALTAGAPNISLTGTYSTSDFSPPGSYNDIGFNTAMVSSTTLPSGSSMTLPSPEMIELYNMPFLQFDSSCLIEFKTSLLASGSGDKRGGAVYRMLP